MQKRETLNQSEALSYIYVKRLWVFKTYNIWFFEPHILKLLVQLKVQPKLARAYRKTVGELPLRRQNDLLFVALRAAVNTWC